MSASGNNIADVWTASVTEALQLPGALEPPSKDEREHAARFRQPADHDRFLAARALLRHALQEASEGQIASEDWSFRIDANGKPEVTDGLPQIAYNLSHSGSCVAVAISGNGPIGIDVESALPDLRLEIIPDVLTAREQGMLRLLGRREQWDRFIRLWTVKEACGKALGLGMGIQFTTFEVALDPLAVRVSESVLKPGLAFNISESRVSLAGIPYVVSVAAIQSASAKTVFRARSL